MSYGGVMSGWQDLNLRPHGSESCALARLSYTQVMKLFVIGDAGSPERQKAGFPEGSPASAEHDASG